MPDERLDRTPASQHAARVVPDGLELGPLAAAALDRARGSAGGTRSRTARVEARHRAVDLGQPLDRRADRRDRAHQADRVRVARPVDHVGDRADLDDAPGVHDRDAVGGLGDHAHVVRHQHHRGAVVAAQALQHLDDLRLDRHVERRRRLVGDDELRLRGERERDDDALAHAARELVRVVVDRRAAPGMPTSSSSATARSRAADSDIGRWVRIVSTIWRPTV
jgi:hypothetical protein